MYQVVQRDGFSPGDVCTTYQATLASPDRAWPADVRAVAAYIHANLFDEDLMVARVKQACGIGDNNISGRFRYYVGQGIKEYIDSHRIKLARRLLQREHVPILVIALEIGYPSHSAFTMGFKKHVGCTPTRFRERIFSEEAIKANVRMLRLND